MNYEPLDRELARITSPVFPTSFSDIYSQYKAQHGKAAIGLLATAVTGHVPPSRSGFAKGSEGYKQANTEYNTARRQIERHVTGQYKGFAPGAQSKLEQIGQTLNPVSKNVPGQGATFTVKFHSDGDGSHSSRERKATISMSGAELYDWVNKKGGPDYKTLFNLWFKDGGLVYGEGGAYPADVTDVIAA